MKNILIKLFFIFIINIPINGQEICKDTIRFNYYEAKWGEFGGVNEGVIIYKNLKNYSAILIQYNDNSYNISNDSLINFYKKNKKKYQILKQIVKLNNNQINFFITLKSDIKKYTQDEYGYSNAPEHYVISTTIDDYILIDKLGSWSKYKEIRKSLEYKEKKSFWDRIKHWFK